MDITEHQQKILEHVTAIVGQKMEIPVYYVPGPFGIENKVISDVALVQCCFGCRLANIEAIRRAMEINIENMNPLPMEWIFIEAQFEESDAKFKYLEQYGIKYRFVKLDESKHRNIFLSGALYNLGYTMTTAKKLAFVDSDIVFCNGGILDTVSKALEKHDLTQICSYAYYSGETNLDRHSNTPIHQTICHKFSVKGDYDGGHPGFSYVMTREFFENIGRFKDPLLNGNDNWFWTKVLGTKKYRPSNYSHYNPVFWHRWGSFPAPRICRTNEVACHVSHGPVSNRLYLASALVERWSSTEEYDNQDYDPMTPEILPTYKDSYNGLLTKKSIENVKSYIQKMDCSEDETAIRYEKDEIVIARNIFDQTTPQVFGEIDDDHPLYVVSLLHTNGVGNQNFDVESVHRHRILFKKLLKTKHRYMCLSDIDIEGIDTIRLVNGKDKCPAQYSQIEYFRKDIFPKNASIFAVDLDCIPVKEFTLPRCQPNSIAMTMEYWQKPHHPVWNGIWNCGAMYFNGDFSDLYNCYIDRINGKLGNLPPYSCTSIQEFITLVLFKYDFHIYDLLRYVQIQLASADFKVAKNVPIKDHSSLYHFLASPKPWTMTVEDTKLQRAIHRIYKLGWRLAEHLIDNDIIELS